MIIKNISMIMLGMLVMANVNAYHKCGDTSTKYPKGNCTGVQLTAPLTVCCESAKNRYRCLTSNKSDCPNGWSATGQDNTSQNKTIDDTTEALAATE